MRFAAAPLVLGATVVRAAINLDGSQAVQPAITDQDASPISNIDTYHPDQHDCPLACTDYANPHSWIPYFSTQRLRRCPEPMLLQFSVTQPLNDVDSTVLIRSCTLGSSNAAMSVSSASVPKVENPKKHHHLSRGSALESAPACVVVGTQVSDKMQLAKSSGLSQDTVATGKLAHGLLKGLRDYFHAKDNCNERFVFAYHNETIAGIYIGAGLGKPTAHSALEALAESLRSDGILSNRTVAQLCGGGRKPERVFGLVLDTSGNLAAVQKMALGWSKGDCARATPGGFLHPEGYLAGVKVFDIAGGSNGTLSANSSLPRSAESFSRRLSYRPWAKSKVQDQDADANSRLGKRGTCRYIQVSPGDGCESLASRCGISGHDFMRHNPQPNFCSNLQPDQYACCSEGDPYTPPKPDPPKPEPDGTCATHRIDIGDTCADLALANGITVEDIERWNRGKTWAWTICKDMLSGYNMCLSNGTAPMPFPQAGTQCGPLVPGTKKPSDPSVSLADLNPCPLKACCSNWGFCGPFPAHCDIHAPEGGGPGSKLKGFQSTCVSNCGTDIKQNSGPPAAFQRIGYYESFGMDRDCLWLKAEGANTDGSYTHIHWAFASIDPNTWKPVINDTKGQWAGFKGLTGVKRILSFGGWAYSTEAATYNILRSAIIENRDTFTTNLAQFVKDEGIDGIDIDWEYPGAPDIYVDGHPIGQKNDGIYYLRFLTVLKNKLGKDKSVSIAAPASFWYLQAFPIDKIASVIDYIVYMTYDLHGQWDYGNVNAFDSCPSGKCIRSHVNLTETRSSLSIITKAGVPNNKIFVGEASYGRSFHMAVPGCWGPMCDFTGSRTQSDAQPGRCTKTGGYIANAEINELLKDGVKAFHDGDSNTDVLLYNQDYVSFMTPTTKDTRRGDWKKLNFAGSIDWAVDLQAFTSADFNNVPDRPVSGGGGCIAGGGLGISSGDLCDFACYYGFCPERLCECWDWGELRPLPGVRSQDVNALDPFDLELNQLCKFSCKYGHCPGDMCDLHPDDVEEVPDVDDEYKICDPGTGECLTKEEIRERNERQCYIYQDMRYSDQHCYNRCLTQIEEAKKNNESTNSGCVGLFPIDKPLPWKPSVNGPMAVIGHCECNNPLVSAIFDEVIDAMATIAQIGCFLIMSALKAVIDIGLSIFPEVGKPIQAGLDAATSAIQTYNYLYDKDQDPGGAFQWWLSPCGSTDLVPDEIKRAFDIISGITDVASSWRKPKQPKGSGKRGDDLNPKDRDRSRLPPGPKPGNAKPPKGKPKPKPGVNKKKKACTTRGVDVRVVGKHTVRLKSCDQKTTVTEDMIVTSVLYDAQATAKVYEATCSERWGQACYHYSSVISRHPNKFARLTCFAEAATSGKERGGGPATSSWSREHAGAGWMETSVVQTRTTGKLVKTVTIDKLSGLCDMDEYPPAYLLERNDPVFARGGLDAEAQMVRFLPAGENRGAGSMWKGVCLTAPLEGMSQVRLEKECREAVKKQRPIPITKRNGAGPTVTQFNVELASMTNLPVFTIAAWQQKPAPNNGLELNTVCWPHTRAPKDPAWALLQVDDEYDAKKRVLYDYKAPYVPNKNGA